MEEKVKELKGTIKRQMEYLDLVHDRVTDCYKEFENDELDKQKSELDSMVFKISNKVLDIDEVEMNQETAEELLNDIFKVQAETTRVFRLIKIMEM